MQSPTNSPSYTLTYLTYGAESFKYQTILSIYTLLHQAGNTNTQYSFVIYTDANIKLFTKYLAGIPVQYEILTESYAKELQGVNNYVYRIKPHIIQDYFNKYKTDLVYLDTDTFFLRDPAPMLAYIAPGQSLMNAEEYNFIDAGTESIFWFNLRQGLKRYTYTIKGEEVQIPLSTYMWNSGIMGISYADAPLMQDIITLNDSLYDRTRTFFVEQFAASYILQKYTKLRSSEDYIEHYWLKEIKNTFNTRLPEFLKQHAAKQGPELYKTAFEFAQQMATVCTPSQEPLLDRVKGRIKVIAKVARHGHL